MEFAELLASCCVATTNLGYAYEHSFKLLCFLATRKNTGPGLRGGDRHKLGKLYDKLPETIRERLVGIYQSVRAHDIEFEEYFGNMAPVEDRESSPSPSELRWHLHYWDRENLLQGSRYKYVDVAATKKRVRIRILIPLRSVEFINRILSLEIAPRLSLEYKPKWPDPSYHRPFHA